MSILKKYTIDFIILILLILFYFLYTEHGQKSFYKLISYSASNKAGVDVNVLSLNLHQYPYVKADILVDNRYAIHIHGYLSDIFSKRAFDMQYTVKSDHLQNKLSQVKAPLDIKGTLKGKRRYFVLKGEGKILDGNVRFDLIKEHKTFKNINLALRDINSTKLLTLFEQKVIFDGKANADLHFDYINKKVRKGTINYRVKDQNFHSHVTDLHVNVAIENEKHIFTIDARTPELSLNLTEGIYDKKTKRAKALFTLDISDLSVFEKNIGENIEGEFHATGNIVHHKDLQVTGTSKSLDGLLTFEYKDTLLTINLTDVPFSSLIKRISTLSLLEANTTGQIVYDVKKREMQSQFELKHTKILSSKLSQTLLKKFNYDIASETFTQSSLEITLKDKVFSSKIILANKKHHLILKDTKFDAKKKILDTHLDLKTPLHFLKGKVYARLDEYITKDLYLKFDGLAEKHYALKLDGLINEESVNMDYTLKTKRFPSHICTIEDNVSVQGHINGSFSRLRVRGKGTALDGNVSYDGIKIGESFDDLTIRMKNIHALKLSTLLGYPSLPSGKADIEVNFSHLSKESYVGKLDYSLSKSTYKSLPLSLNAHVDIDQDKQLFKANIQLGETNIDLSKGLRDAKSNLSSAFFTVNSKNLTQLEGILGEKYLGSFFAMGNVSYKDKLQIRGLTKTFGGMIDFLYKDEMLLIDIEGSSLKNILSLFTDKPLLDATTIGNINYDYNKKLLLISSKLQNAKFEPSKLTNTVFNKSGVNMHKEIFTNSTLNARYQNKILKGSIELKNDTSYFRLNNILLNNEYKTVNALFDINIQKQEFSGKIYGTLDEPKINLDMQKLLKYQMDKQLDNYMGKGNRKLMESMPMGKTAKDMATDMGGSFMDIFF